MKKSNALMVSYMAFLIIALLASAIFQWDGLDKIAMATTIAGCFFAFADLAGWYVSYYMIYEENFKKINASFLDFYSLILNVIDKRCKEYSESKNLLLPYIDSNGKINPFINALEDRIKEGEKDKQKLHTIKKSSIYQETLYVDF